ncbi:MAG: TldD/PmbA family protein [Candidatus Wallbacteria bacterium]|nr:TldD/PmbA family protein [Candidatus Wallbacteria bacterium]
MEAPFSQYLEQRIPALSELLASLADRFQFISILGADTSGKEFAVSRSASEIKPTAFTECGFVIRMQRQGVLGEFSINGLPADMEKLHDLICTKAEKIFSFSDRFDTQLYPAISCTGGNENFRQKVEVVPDESDTEHIMARLKTILDRLLNFNSKVSGITLKFSYEKCSKFFLTPAGCLTQSLVYCDNPVYVNVRDDHGCRNLYQVLSRAAGLEVLDLIEENLVTAVKRALELPGSAAVEPGIYEIICSPDISGLIAHETFGHGTEADMLVQKRALSAQYIGRQVANPVVTLFDNPTLAGGYGSYFFDDEGTPASCTEIIGKGVLLLPISDLPSAWMTGFPATGNGRRESFKRKAYPRMSNTYFAPGESSLDEMIRSVGRGFLLECGGGGVEDPKNWHLHCSSQFGREIADGRLTGRIVSPVILTGFVPDLLQSISMVSRETSFDWGGICTKGRKEGARVTLGGPYIKALGRLG